MSLASFNLSPPGPEKQKCQGGYAAPPGTGPEGKTCGTCRHLYRRYRARSYLKCFLMREHWTGGPGTDIKISSPACQYWGKLPEADRRSPGQRSRAGRGWQSGMDDKSRL